MKNRKDTFYLNDKDLWIKHFHEEGYCIIRDLYNQNTIDEAILGCKRLVDELAKRLLEKGKIINTFDDSDFDSRLIDLCASCPNDMPNLFRSELHKSKFFSLLCNSDVMDVVRRLMNPNVDAIRIFPNYSCRPKTKARVHDVVWHQDAGLRADGGPSTASIHERLDAFGVGSVVNCWAPLVEVSRENGAMKFLPGSHHRGILDHVLLGSYSGASERGEKLQDHIIKEEVNEKAQNVPAGTYMTGVSPNLIKNDLQDAIDIECSPRDLVLFNNLLVHCGGVNSTDKIRWSFDWRFQDANKSTFRKETGHVISSKSTQNNCIPKTPSDWAKLKFM